MKVLKNSLSLINKAFKYNLIKGAAIVKVVQAILVISGTQPWTTEMNVSIETLIDFTVGIIVLIGVGQAHEAQPDSK